jgi:threonine aldolase
VCGNCDVIDRVHRLRKMFGGGMRQVGILAAAGLHALEHHVDRLAEDHHTARRLAAGLQRLGLKVDPPPETNMVLFEVEDAAAFLGAASGAEVLVNPVAERRFRAVTHLDVTATDIGEALERLGRALTV